MSPADASGTYRHFHEQLSELTQHLLDMSDKATALIDLAVDALLSRDTSAADAVLVGDRELDAMELEVEDMAVGLLALQQPMARDLRFLVSTIKVSSDLERVGDHAVNIAQSTLRLAAMRTRITPDPEIADMARRARRMLGDALTAFVRGDGALGRAVCQADDAVHDSMFRILLTHMMADPHTINASLELLLVSRNLERVADLATNIGEDAVFLAEGKTIKHHAEKRPGTPPTEAAGATPAPSAAPGGNGAAGSEAPTA
jgi:phosphate transport system protein